MSQESNTDITLADKYWIQYGVDACVLKTQRDMQSVQALKNHIADAPKMSNAEITPMIVVMSGSESLGMDCADEPVWRDPCDPIVAVPAGRVYRTEEVIVCCDDQSEPHQLFRITRDTNLDNDHLIAIRLGTGRTLGHGDDHDTARRLRLSICRGQGDHLWLTRSHTGSIRDSQNHLFDSLAGSDATLRVCSGNLSSNVLGDDAHCTGSCGT